MSDTQARVQQLLKLGAVQVSQHGFARLDKNEIDLADVIAAMQAAKVVEDHPDYPLGPCVLVLVRDSNNDPVHILWGIPKGQLTPATLVTAYRPDHLRWSTDFLQRKKS